MLLNERIPVSLGHSVVRHDTVGAAAIKTARVGRRFTALGVHGSHSSRSLRRCQAPTSKLFPRWRVLQRPQVFPLTTTMQHLGNRRRLHRHIATVLDVAKPFLRITFHLRPPRFFFDAALAALSIWSRCRSHILHLHPGFCD